MHPDRPRYDVVVVGARPAGAATAMLLARAGLRVLVVDRSRYGADALSTHALLRGGVLQLHRWGLLDRLVEAGTPAVRRTTFRYHDEEVVIAIKPSHGVDALYAPRRTILDPLLVDAAAEAGAEVRYGVTVVGLRSDRRGRVAGIDGRDDAGRPLAVGAALVVGADGLRSTVARHVSAPVLRTGTGASAVVYGYWADVATDGYEWIFRPDACAGVIPTNDGLACVFAAATPARVGRGGRTVLEAVLAQASPAAADRVRAGTAPSGVRTFRGYPGLVRGYTFGSFDLLKVRSSYRAREVSRDTRWQWLGLVNEPCFDKASGKPLWRYRKIFPAAGYPGAASDEQRAVSVEAFGASYVDKQAFAPVFGNQ